MQFVNAQGVFGFINQHRVNVVLQYTHDPLPLPTAAAARPPCTDDEGGWDVTTQHAVPRRPSTLGFV